MEKKSNGMKKSIEIHDLGKINSFPELLRAFAYIIETETKEEQKEQEEQKEIKVTVEEAITRISNKLNISYSDANKFLGNLAKINKAAAFSVVSKELAIILDNKYDGMIKDSEKIFGISLFDGKIHELNKASIKSYKNFAAFRTIEDAKLVRSLLKDKLDTMFKWDSEKTVKIKK